MAQPHLVAARPRWVEQALVSGFPHVNVERASACDIDVLCYPRFCPALERGDTPESMRKGICKAPVQGSAGRRVQNGCAQRDCAKATCGLRPYSGAVAVIGGALEGRP